MLKFKNDSDNLKNEFDLVEISSSKTKHFNIIDINTIKIPVNDILNTFMNMFSDSEGLKSLKSFLITTSLWDLLLSPSDEQFPLIQFKIIHYYFSIPDRLSSAFKLETDEFFFPRNFFSFTEDSLQQAFTNTNSSSLKRFIFALERLEGFALQKLIKIPSFWDSLDFELISQLSTTSKQLFLAHLHKNLLSFNFQKLFKIIRKLSLNLRLEVDDLVQLFHEQFICKGLVDYKELATLTSAYKDYKSFNSFLINILTEVFKIWSNDSWTFRTPFNSQLHFSSCIMIISSLVSPDLFTTTAYLEESLMNGVQTRLDHSDPQIRLMGCCVAEILNLMHPESESKLDFEIDPNNEIVTHLKDCQKLTRHVAFGYPQYTCMFIEETTTNTATTATTDTDTAFASESVISDTLNTEQFDFDSDDLKPISSLLKEEEPKNSKTPIPRFLSDCLKLLRSNEDAESVEKVLYKLDDTFKTSSRLSRQIHSVSAFNTLLTLNDHFEIKNFDSLRHRTMEIILIDQIKSVGPDLIDSIFKSNKLVLGQKMELLSIICSSTQKVFNPKIKEQIENQNLNQFEKTFLVSENSDSDKSKEKEKAKNISEYLDCLCLPLLTQSIRHFQHFKRNHVMFLEKFLWLQAIILNFSKNYLQFDFLVEKYLDLIHLTLQSSSNSLTISGASTNLVEQIPIQKALLLGTSVVLTSWPARFPVIQYYQRLQEIYTFLDEVVNGPGFKEDEQLQSLGTSVALALQDLTDPQKLIQESAEQLSFDLKTVKITNLSK